MAKRKQYVIDKKFQFKATFSIIFIVTILSAIVITAIAASVVYNNQKIQNIYEIEDNIVLFLTSGPGNTENKAYKSAIKEIAINHSNNMASLNRIMSYNKLLLTSILIFVVVQGILLYFLLIRKTHRISGPIYVMSMYMKDIIDGTFPNPRKLRDKDDLKEFYELFSRMVETLKNKYGK